MPDYRTLFNIDDAQMLKLISTAMSKGGEYADIYFEYCTSDFLTIRDNQVNDIGSDIDFGCGIRVIKESRTGYAYSESTDFPALEKAALSAAQIADDPSSDSISPAAFKSKGFENHYPILKSWDEFPVTERKEFLQKLDEEAFAADPRIIKVTARLSFGEDKVMFCNCLGDFFCDNRPLASVTISCVAREGDRAETISVSRSYRTGSEILTDALIKDLTDEVARQLPLLFEASRPQGGQMPVVMGAGGSGILLHEAIGHAFEADFNRKGISIFSDMMGKKICSEKINIVDDATLKANRGSLNIDDEGVVGQKTYMVKDGVLNSYLHDRISARHYGVAPTGNGRRESFRFNPIPRMRATYMENGQASAEDIISSVKKGIFVDSFSNGQVEIGAGDFTFFVKSGFLIEDGHLTAPIKDINIIGNGPQALADIEEVASDGRMENSTWTCGKDQSCYVSCGMPTVLVKSLTVGGSN